MTLSTFCEGMSTVNKPSCDDLLQAGTADPREKLAVLPLRDYCMNTLLMDFVSDSCGDLSEIIGIKMSSNAYKDTR